MLNKTQGMRSDEISHHTHPTPSRKKINHTSCYIRIFHKNIIIIHVM